MAELRYVSFGAGVQSSALIVMAALGLRGCPQADLAIFADTRDEPWWVYQHLWTMRGWALEHGMDIRSVSRGRLSADPTVRIPAFVAGKDGVAAPLTRNCTRDYKLTPIHQELRREMERREVSQTVALMGISVDEADRMRTSDRKWLRYAYPLVDAAMTRSACAALLEEHGLPVPRKSACTYCPWRSDTGWREVRDYDPEGWAQAVAFDARLRAERGASLHRSLIPLAEVPLGDNHPSLFGNECEGVCGV